MPGSSLCKALTEYYENALRWGCSVKRRCLVRRCSRSAGETIPDEARQRIGPYLDAAALLGRRTAELHLALASVPDDPEFRAATVLRELTDMPW